MGGTAPAVDAFLARAALWRTEMAALRAVLLACGLDESLKWGKPCYGVDGKNVAIIQPFKAHCALMFFKGALLTDTHGLLRRQGPHSEAAKRLEFTGATPIVASTVNAYVKQAIAVEKAGRSVRPSAAPRRLDLPAELASRLKKDRRLAAAFAALTPGRQRAYALHIADAKQPATREARLDRCAPRILAGKGLNER